MSKSPFDQMFEEVMALKQKAVVLRNRSKFGLALSVLDEVVVRLQQMAAEPDDDVRRRAAVQAELADTFGMRGGVNRRLDDLEAALADYSAGVETEGPDSPNTYNLGNVIALTIARDPARIQEPVLMEQLREAIRRLERQTAGARCDEWWAWADLGQFRLLCGDGEGARAAYVHGRATGPSLADYQRSLNVLSSIATALEASNKPLAGRIQAFIAEMGAVT